MDYAKLAIIIWIVASSSIALLGWKLAFKRSGISANKINSPAWGAYVFCCAGLGGVIAIGLTWLIRGIAG